MRTGIVLDGNFNMVIRDGSFWPEPSAEGESRLILESSKGEFRYAPEVGVNLTDMLLDERSLDEIEAEITEQFEMDRLLVTEVRFTEQGFDVAFEELDPNR